MKLRKWEVKLCSGRYSIQQLITLFKLREPKAQSIRNMTSRSKIESQKAIRLCKNKCVICGWDHVKLNGDPLVEGCHILDYAKDPSYDRASNIIALCPNHHAEFDQFCFYIDTEQRTLVCANEQEENSGICLDIEYVDKRCLAWRQAKVLQAWSERLKGKQ